MPSYNKRDKRWQGFYQDINRNPKTKYFATKEEAIIWEKPFKEAVKQERARIKKSKTSEQRRKEYLEINGNNRQTEATATMNFCELLKNKYDFLQIRDNAHNDLALQFKSKKSKKYYALQIKSCSKRIKFNRKRVDGSQAVSYTHLTLPTKVSV